MTVLATVGLVAGLLQTPAPTGVAGPQRDPITLRGCVEGRRVQVIEHDATELTGIRNLRLRGSRALLDALRDATGGYFELAGRLERGQPDRIETQRTRRIGSKTAVTIGAAAEQHRGEQVTFAEPDFMLEAFTRLDGACPTR